MQWLGEPNPIDRLYEIMDELGVVEKEPHPNPLREIEAIEMARSQDRLDGLTRNLENKLTVFLRHPWNNENTARLTRAAGALDDVARASDLRLAACEINLDFVDDRS